MPTDESQKRIENLRNLLNKGRLSPKLKSATRKLISALEKGDRRKIGEISWLHQDIGGDWEQKYGKQEYREDDEWNQRKVGTTAYYEFDIISHGAY